MEYPEKVTRYFELAPDAPSLEGRLGFCVAGDAGRESEGLRIWFAVQVHDGQVADACFRAYGCPYAIATAAHIARLLPGRDSEAHAVAPLEIARELGLPDEKLNCALCAEDALGALWANWRALEESNPVAA